LLDTHVFLWAVSAPERLSESVRALLQDTANEWLLSLVSVWEIQIKATLGKLSLDLPLAELLAREQSVNGLGILPIQLPHILALSDLPRHHNDPFDRLLAVQARLEDLPLLSIDRIFDAYAVARMW
jgi:PIN domain nuclease of toxin-antitoxin system